MLEFFLNNTFLLSIVAFGIMLIPAIIIHELGHFFAAKMVGINVLEFGIGFPPRIKRLFVWGETEFTLNWLPLGGFVRPLGEDMIGPVVEDDEEYPEDDYAEDKQKRVAYMTEREELMSRGVPEDKLMSVNEAKPLPRIFFMAAGAMANVLSAIVFFIIAALLGLPIEVGARIQLSDIPANSVFDQGQIAEWDAIELFNGDYFASETEFLALWQESYGEAVNLTLRHPYDFDDEELAGEQYTIMLTPQVTNVEPYALITGIVEDSPAHTAGLQAGDRVVAVDGERLPMSYPVSKLIEAIDEAAGSGFTLTILRAGETFDIFVVPREDPEPNQGKLGVGVTSAWETSDGVMFQNANPQIEFIPQSVGDSVAYGFGKTGDTFKLMAQIPGQIISGVISPEQARPVSIIGISQLGGQFLQRSILDGAPYYVLEFIALISIFLGISNILPLFPLPVDGTRIVFVIIEMVRGKPIPLRIENMVYRVGLAILLILSIAIILLDIFFPLI